MASIRKVKLKKGPPKVYIIQSYKDEAGITHQSWIQCADEAEAKELLDDVRAAERENRIYEKPQALNTPLPYAAVAPEDVGRVIGKHGRVAQAIRTIVYSVRVDDSLRVRLNIVDD